MPAARCHPLRNAKRGNKSGVTMSGCQEGVESRSHKVSDGEKAEKVVEQYATEENDGGGGPSRFLKGVFEGGEGPVSWPVARN